MNAMPSYLDDGAVLRVPPHSVEAEQSVLGGVMLAPEALRDVRDVLTPADFYRRDHQLIFEAICDLADREQPFDTVLLINWFENAGKLDLVSNGAYLVELSATVPSAANIKAYAAVVRNKALLRGVITTATDVANDAYAADDAEAEAVVSGAASKFASLTVQSSGTGGLLLLRGDIQGMWEEMEARYNGTAELGLVPPWKSVAVKLPGLEPTDLMVIAARPSMGKTANMLEWCYSAAAEQGRAVAVFSLEMGRRQLLARLMSMHSGVPLSRMRVKGELTNDDWHKLAVARNHLQGLPLAIDDCGSLPVDALVARASRMHAKVPGGLGLVALDYLQLVSGPAKVGNRTEEVSYISRTLKQLAKNLQCPVIALSQLNRGVETRTDKRPGMADLRESGAIEQDADVIAMLYRDDYYTKDACGAPGVSEFILAKNRQGETGTAYLRHHLECSRFESYFGDKPNYSLRTAARRDDDDGFDVPRSRRSGKDLAAGAVE
ncbi:replicative DNA helicase [Stenotrophomonas sp. ATCM1_4]|uniref:replicative DNA helicase n=1 Tax=Stenotrophomonas sp. ATCM1_4 TaxID=2259330 RepID=UPI00104EF922|nr:replicative DNA helicase [Stenotrophomonas sp. ATCM1_4]TDB26836.1 replicative DNA helicase [Stenotrophomonas sp. ATCM1_4]